MSPPTSTIVPTLAPDEAFAQAIYHRLNVDDTTPVAGKQVRISLYHNRPSTLFPANASLVLVYEVPVVPPSQEETTKAAVRLNAAGIENHLDAEP